MLGSTIHNHVGRDEDVRPGGWSGLVYLNPKPPPSAGTTIWRHRGTGRCWTLESKYCRNWDDFEPVLEVENRYNRLILFYASVYHLAASGWGSKREDARMFQTFFWNVRRNGRVETWRDLDGSPQAAGGSWLGAQHKRSARSFPSEKQESGKPHFTRAGRVSDAAARRRQSGLRA
jgi:hypothetical protein